MKKFVTDTGFKRLNEWLAAYIIYIIGQLTAEAIGINTIITEDEEYIVTDEDGIIIIAE